MIADATARGVYLLPSGAIVARHQNSETFRERLSAWMQTPEGARWRAGRLSEQRRARADAQGRLTRTLALPSPSFEQTYLDALVRALAVDGALPELHRVMEAEVERLESSIATSSPRIL